MSELPDSWSLAALGEVCEVLDSRRVPVNARERANRSGSVPYYGATGQVGWIDQALFDEELVLLGEDGAPFLDTGKDKAYLIRGPAWVNNHAHVIRANGLTTNSFLLHALNATDYRRFVNGTTRLKLTQAAMRVIPIPVPPLREQERMVAAIEEQFSRLDQAVHLLHSVIRRAAILRSSILRDSTDGDWPRKRLADLAEIRLGRQRSPKNHSGPHMVPYLRAANVTWEGLALDDVKSMNFEPNEAETFRLLPGDVLVAEASGSPGEVGKPAIWRGEIPGCCFQNTLVRVRPMNIEAEWLHLVIYEAARSGRLGEASPGVGIHHIGASRLAEWPIPVPPQTARSRIISEVTDRLDSAETVSLAAERALLRTARLRRSILERAFSGQLVPQDPSDEPASKLLSVFAAATNS